MLTKVKQFSLAVSSRIECLFDGACHMKPNKSYCTKIEAEELKTVCI